jgi:phosphoribosyl-dephospho-CoA transferase
MKGPHPGGRAGHEARAARRRLGTGANIVRSVTPEMLAERERLLRSPFVSQPPVQAAIALTLPLAVALGHHRQHRLRAGHRNPGTPRRSDLDLLIRAPQPLAARRCWNGSPGGQAAVPGRYPGRNAVRRLRLNEWLRDGRALLKTSRGARLTAAPWHREE